MSPRFFSRIFVFLTLLAPMLPMSAADAARCVLEPDGDWAPYAHSVEIAPGGVFDFAQQCKLDAPAGKYGALSVTSGGHFEFEKRPGQRVRFWGPNLTFTANYLSKSEADRLAERLARSGYNTVRLHHFDRDLVRQGGDSWDLDPEKLDQLEYLFAAMKKRGIYINIDLFSSRAFSGDECVSFGFAGKNMSADDYKGLVPISESAFRSWARFAKNLLTHRNPHTGLTWAEDPALIGICPVNEDQLFNRIKNPVVLDLYKKAFVRSGAGQPDDAGKRSSHAWNRFIIECQIRSNARIFSYLRGLGVRALLTGSNSETTQSETFLREHYDYVDNHAYWDHPKFPGRPWQPPFAFNQNKSTTHGAAVPRKLFATRVFGLPFTVTEFNFCRPNRHRHEGAVLMPAYAGLQDWDAIYNFQYAKDRESALAGATDNYFAIANDPIGIVADRVGALLFLRGDIAPARGALVWGARPEEAFSDQWIRYPDAFTKLGLVTRIGSLSGQPDEVLAKADALKSQNIAAVVIGQGQRFAAPEPLPARTYVACDTLAADLRRAGVLSAGAVNAAATHHTSDTGQIELRTDEGAMRVVTPCSELFVVTEGANMSGDIVTISSNTADASISVVSLDGKPLSQARRILVTHLTDALPAGATFTALDRKVLGDWGGGPHLVRRGEATLSLRLPEPEAWTCWAVDATGARAREVPLEKTPSASGARLRLRLATITPEGTQLAYELARRETNTSSSAALSPADAAFVEAVRKTIAVHPVLFRHTTLAALKADQGYTMKYREKPAHMAQRSEAEWTRFALSLADAEASKTFARILPAAAMAARLSGDKIITDYVVAQLAELATWSPLQRPGWSGGSSTRAAWLGTGWAVRAIVQSVALLPDGAVTPELRAALAQRLEDEIAGIRADWREKRTWFARIEAASSNQWALPLEALALASIFTGIDAHRDDYEFAVAGLLRTLNAQGPRGECVEGALYAAITCESILSAALAGKTTGDTRLLDHPWMRAFPSWYVQHRQPAGLVINAFDAQNTDLDWELVAQLAAYLDDATARWTLARRPPQKSPAASSLALWRATRGAPDGRAAKPPALYDAYEVAARVNWLQSLAAYENDDANKVSGLWIRGGHATDAHDHQDRGHISFTVAGRPVLVEAGLSSYGIANHLAFFKSVAGHNVLQVGDCPPAGLTQKILDAGAGQILDPAHRAAPITVHRLDETGGDVTVDASNCYANLKRWTRTAAWNATTLTVRDEVELPAPDTLLFRWHLGEAPEAPVTHPAPGKIQVGDTVIEYDDANNTALRATVETMPGATAERGETNTHATVVIKTSAPAKTLTLQTKIHLSK